MVRVLHIKSLSYTGTTWLNLVLGSHPQALALGSMDRAWNILTVGKDLPHVNVHEDEGAFCLIHGAACPFWPSFASIYNPEENLYEALARFSDKSLLVTNNASPDKAGSAFGGTAIDLVEMNLVRDARHVLASYKRRNPKRSTIDALVDFLQPSLGRIAGEAISGDKLLYRYEDILADQLGFLAAVSNRLGVTYSESALDFCEWEHHLSAGNPGVVMLLRLSCDMPVADFEGRDFYAKQYSSLENGQYTFSDERPGAELNREDLILFDSLAGEDNARLGYARDEYSRAERYSLKPLVRALLEQRDIPPEYDESLRRYFGLAVNPAQLKRFPEKDRASNSTSIIGALRRRLYRSKLSGKDSLGIGKTEKSRSEQSFNDESRESEFLAYKTGQGDKDLKEIASWCTSYNNVLNSIGQVNSFSVYENLVEHLWQGRNFKVVGLGELMDTETDGRTVVSLRHDIDSDVFTGLACARCLSDRGIPGSFFLLHTSHYYGFIDNGVFFRQPGISDLVKEYVATGQEVGLHNDPLHLYLDYGIDGTEAMSTEVMWLRSLGAKVDGVVAHNSAAAYGAENFEIFEGLALENRQSVTHRGNTLPLQTVKLKDLDLIYEGNFALPPDPIAFENLEDFVSRVPPDALRNPEWQATYFNQHPIFSRAYDYSLWVVGQDNWVFARHKPEKAIFSGLSTQHALKLLSEIPRMARVVITIHPVYVSGEK